jgi:hypothetical protein
MPVQVDGLLFEEQQQFRQRWLWWPVGGIFVFLAAVFGAAYLAHPAQSREIVGSAVFAFAVGGAVALLLYTTRLTVRLDQETIHVRYFPFLTRDIPLERIARWEAVTYRPIRDYGGWGIRFGFKARSWAYNLSGNRGVRFEFTDGKRLMIGSQRPEEFAAAVAQAKGHESM